MSVLASAMRCSSSVSTSRALSAPSCSFAVVPAAARLSTGVRHSVCAARQQKAKQWTRQTVVVNAISAGEGMAPKLRSAIDQLIQTNKIVVFMKGTKQFPQCGFSHTVVQILRNLDAQFESVNILENEALRSGMKEYSQWPTFPQVYIDGEFYGGCDIMIEAYQSGELPELLERLKNE